MDRESLELLLDAGLSIAKIAQRFRKDPSTVSYWVSKYGLESPYKGRHAAKGALDRRQLEEMIDRGCTIAEVAAAVGRSHGTVRHWMMRYGLRSHGARGDRTSVKRAAKEAGQLQLTMKCQRHGETEFILEGRGYYRCKKCRGDAVVRHRQKVKAVLVEEAGGECVVCGYSRSLRALHFHHLDPELKRLGLSGHGVTYSLETLRSEAQKCVLLCANCHTEVEDGTTSLPLELTRRAEPPESLVGRQRSAIHHDLG